jgi:hypothetical protein
MLLESLAAIVVINLVITMWMWSKLPKPPKKKFYRNLTSGSPITPKHQRPKTIDSLADEAERQTLIEFRDFGDVVNWWLADEHLGSRWRLQELADTHLQIGFRDSPAFGRRYELYFGPQKLGTLEVTAGYHPRFARTYNATIELMWVRLLPWEAVTTILRTIADHICDNDKASHDAASIAINGAMTVALWDSLEITGYDFGGATDWGNLELTLSGPAPFYLDRRNSKAFRELRA